MELLDYLLVDDNFLDTISFQDYPLKTYEDFYNPFLQYYSQQLQRSSFEQWQEIIEKTESIFKSKELFHPYSSPQEDIARRMLSRLADHQQSESLFYWLNKVIHVLLELLSLGENQVATLLIDMGLYLYNINEIDNAYTVFSKANSFSLSKLGKMNKQTAFSYQCMAATFVKTGDYSDASYYNTKSLSIYYKLLGIDDLDTIESFEKQGAIEYNLQNFDDSFKYHYAALDARLKLLGISIGSKQLLHDLKELSNLEIGRAFRDTGWALREKEDATVFLLIASSIFKDLVGEEHIELISTYIALAEHYALNENFAESLIYYHKAADIAEKLDDCGDYPLQSLYFDMAGTLLQLNEYPKAIMYSLKSLRIYQMVKGAPDKIEVLCKILYAAYILDGNAPDDFALFLSNNNIKF